MKKASKYMIIMVIVLVVTFFAGNAAFASYYDTQADTLYELGLFKGTDNGYELDQTSTRAQAAVMLVRMLGKEAEALAGSYTDPFADVPEWAENYIGYMYENGLTNGTSATTFGSDEACSARMFSAFVLRALGYSEENGDFTYDRAQEFAAEIGLAGTAFYSEAFLRDNMAALAYSALFQNMKDGDTTLLEKLVSENAVDASAAEKHLESYDTYQSYLADCAQANQTESVRISARSELGISVDDETRRISQTLDISVVLKEDNDFIMKLSFTADDGGEAIKMTSYYSDGWLYTETEGMKYKQEYSVDLTDVFAKSGLNQTAGAFYSVGSIEKTETANGFSYKIEYSVSALNEFFGLFTTQLPTPATDAEMPCNYLETTVDFDANGDMKRSTTSESFSIVAASGDQETSVINIDSVSVFEILETGDSVTVTLPDDLDEYIEMDTTLSGAV